MPRSIRTVKVTFLNGEPLRAMVESWSTPGEFHMVDLAAKYPLGECSCKQWACRCHPEFKRTGRPIRCRHLASAREALLNRVIRENSGEHDGSGE